MNKYDVVIVGGGIAGVAAAATLAENSKLNVLLVEKDKIGSNETTRAVFADVIQEFNLEKSVICNYTKYVFHSAQGAQASFDYQKNSMMAIDYKKACKELWQRAQANGLILLKKKAVSFSLASNDSPLVIKFDEGESVQTEMLIDASGYVQWAAKLLNITASPYYSISFGEILNNAQIEDTSSFRLLAPYSAYGNGGGWAYPLDKSTLSFGYSVVCEKLEGYALDLKKGYFAAKANFEPYATWVKNSFSQKEESGIIPVGRIGRFTSNRVLIVGDAAGQANPWAIEGVRPALRNGRLAAEICILAFAEKKFNNSFLKLFERKWNKQNKERFWRTKSSAQITWFKTSDLKWEQIVKAHKTISPSLQYEFLKENRVPFWVSAYAILGFLRRSLVKKAKNIFK